MHRVDDLVDVAGLAGPRTRVDNLAFFRVRGNCLSPTIQDGDVVLAAWRLLSVAQFAPARGEVAVFLVRWPGEERAAVVLNRWPCTGSHGAPATLASNTGEVTLTSSQVALLADRVRLVQEDAFAHRPAQPYDCAAGSMFFHHLADEAILRLVSHLRTCVWQSTSTRRASTDRSRGSRIRAWPRVRVTDSS